MKKFTLLLNLTVIFASHAIFCIDPHLERYVLDTTVVETGVKNLKADLSFLFIDFKYDGNIKICEFGRAKTAGLGDTPCTMSIYGEPSTMFTPYWPSFWRYLEQCNMPVWFVGIKPADHKTASLNETESNDSWNQFMAMGGNFQPSLDALENDHFFKQVKRNGSYQLSNHYAKFSSHKGIIIYKPRASDRANYKSFKERHPQFIYLDDVGSKYGAFKHIGAELFNDPSISMYKPRYQYYEKKYTNTLAQQIIDDIKSDIFVIKPVAGGYARGVIMVTKQDLDETLKYICGNHSALKIPAKAYERQSYTYSYWKHDREKLFIVEEYCASTPIFIHEKFYDPTIRFYFTLRHDDGKMYINIFGGYYKIPVKSLHEEATLTEKHKTVPYYKSDVPLSALTLPDDLFKAITKELKIMLPKIYLQMLKNHPSGLKTPHTPITDN